MWKVMVLSFLSAGWEVQKVRKGRKEVELGAFVLEAGQVGWARVGMQNSLSREVTREGLPFKEDTLRQDKDTLTCGRCPGPEMEG